MEAVQVSSQRVGQNEGVAPVVFGASGRVTVTKAVQLFRMNRENRKAVFGKRLDDGSSRDLHRDRNECGPITRCGSQPFDEISQAAAAVFNPSLIDDFPFAVQTTDTVPLGAPVDSDKHLKCIWQCTS